MSAQRGHLVTAGRYDGLDLVGEICRLVIITTVPRANSEIDRFMSSYLGDATFLQQRVGQRVTQAIGRANRTPEDYALYLGLDPRFAHVLASHHVQQAIPEHARSTVMSALEVYDRGLAGAYDACDEFWNDKSRGATPQTRAHPHRRRPGRSADVGSRASSATHEIAAATELWLGSYSRSADFARQAYSDLVNVGEPEHAAFWKHVEAHAHYARGDGAGLAASRAALKVAIENGPRTAWFRRLERLVEALDGREVRIGGLDSSFLLWDEWLRDFGSDRLDAYLSRARADLSVHT